MRFTNEPLPGDPTLRAALYGPLVLAADLGPGPAPDSPLRIGGYDSVPSEKLMGPPAPPPVAHTSPDPQSTAWIEVVSPKDLAFKAYPPTPIQPLYQITGQKYAVYWTTAD
jgi:hypothetical protein